MPKMPSLADMSQSFHWPESHYAFQPSQRDSSSHAKLSKLADFQGFRRAGTGQSDCAAKGLTGVAERRLARLLLRVQHTHQRYDHMLRSIVLLVAFAAARAADAQSFEASTAIDQAVEASLGQAFGAQGGAAYRVDPRLRLTRCPSALAISTVGAAAVEVRCPDIGWRLRVPVLATIPATSLAVVIKRGDTVKILLTGAGFEIATSGIALEDGTIGNGMRVKSLTDGSVFRATVVESGFVELRD
jgi:flagellar basal body P-ring formation protein FlgA